MNHRTRCIGIGVSLAVVLALIGLATALFHPKSPADVQASEAPHTAVKLGGEAINSSHIYENYPAQGELIMRVNPDHNWVHGDYDIGYTVWLTLTNSSGDVKDTAQLTTQAQDWGGTGFNWNLQSRMVPGDWVYGVISSGYTATVHIGQVTGFVDVDANTITGTVSAVWLMPGPVDIWCEAWGAPGAAPNKQTTVIPDGSDVYTCAWDPDTEWDVQAGQNIAVRYYEPTGQSVYGVFYAPVYDLILRVNYVHNWIEGNYEAGYTVGLTATNSLGEIKATAVLTTGEIPWWGGQTGFSTNLDNPWQPQPPDIKPGDFVYGAVSTGYTATVHVGQITGFVDVDADTITGTLDAPWLLPGPVEIQCYPWGVPGNALNKQAAVIPDGNDVYTCAWDSVSEWDIKAGQDIAVTYSEPAGHHIFAVYSAPVYDLIFSIQYGQHNRIEGRYELGHTIWLTITDRLGNPKGATVVQSAYVEPWDDTGYTWEPENFTIQPYDWVYGATDSGYTGTVQVGHITGFTDSNTNSITGTVRIPGGMAQPLDVWCSPWIWPDWAPGKFSTIYPNGSDVYTCAWNPATEWAMQPGLSIGVDYRDPAGHQIIRGFRVMDYDLRLTINADADWIRGPYAPGHTLWLTVTNSIGEIKAIAEITTGEIPWWNGDTGFSTSYGNPWQPEHPNIEPGDWVYGVVDNGYTAMVQLGRLTGSLDMHTNSIAGTVDIPWLMPGPVEVECQPWDAPGGTPNKYDPVIPNGSDVYSCAWDPVTEWAIGLGQNLGVAYYDPDGHQIVAVFRSMFAPDSPGWQQVNADGFGDPKNVIIQRMAVLGSYLYAGTENYSTGGEVWRTTDGANWNRVNLSGFGIVSNTGVVLGDEPFNGYLYAGTGNSATGGEIWRCAVCNGADWTQVVSGGFGDSNNNKVNRIIVFSDTLYAAVDNGVTGVELWKSPTGDPGSWTQCNVAGFGDAKNAGLWELTVFNGHLYVATAQWKSPDEDTSTGVEVWRCATCDGADWTQVNTDGFGDRDNFSPGMESFDGYLYVSSFNYNTGTQIWRCATCDSPTDWTQVVGDGFANNDNYGAFLVSFGGELYAFTSNWVSGAGAEIWRTTNGTDWRVEAVGGLGDNNNGGMWSKAIFGGRLYVGTKNWGTGGEVWMRLPASCHVRVSSLPGITYNDLQAAIDAAQPGDTLKVAGTCSTVHSRPDALSPTGVVTQVAHIAKALTLQGGYTTTNWLTPNPTANPTTLDARDQGRVFYATGGVNVTVDGFRITGGNATRLGGVPWGWDAGGGLYVVSATVTLNNNRIYDNYSTHLGGGLFLWRSTPTLNGNVVNANTAGFDGGGALFYESNAMLNSNTIATNTSTHAGGGIAAWGGELTLNGNIIRANVTRGDGGGLSGGGNIVLANTIVADNQANRGGGIYIEGSVRLLHNTIVGNTSHDGSGIYVGGPTGAPTTVALTNTILAQSSVGISVTGGNTVTVNGILWYATPITVSQSATATVTIQNQVAGDPRFDADGYHLRIGSAALDAGIPTALTRDIDGDPRPYGNGFDLGADEAPYVVIPPETGGTLVYTNTQGSTTTLVVPPAAVSETTTIVLTQLDPETVAPPPDLAPSAIAVKLDAYLGDERVTNFTFNAPVTLTLAYTDADVAGIDESTLRLYRYVCTGPDTLLLCVWELIGTRSGERQALDPVNNVLTAVLTGFTRFGGMGVSLQPVLEVSKTDSGNRVAGTPVTYTLTVVNTSSADATAVTLEDVVPQHLTWTNGGTLLVDRVRWYFEAITATGGTGVGQFSALLPCTASLAIVNDDYRVVSSAQGVTSTTGLPVSFDVIAPTVAVGINYTPAAPVAGEVITFTATATTNGTPLTYAWSLGGTGPSATHTYAEAGPYTVTVTATDACGYARVATATFDVKPAGYTVYLPLVMRNK